MLQESSNEPLQHKSPKEVDIGGQEWHEGKQGEHKESPKEAAKGGKEMQEGKQDEHKDAKLEANQEGEFH